MYTHECIGIVRGGEVYERERSLELGAALLRICEDISCTAKDIFIDDTGTWWKGGVHTEPSRILDTLSMVIPAFPGISPTTVRTMTLAKQHGVPYLGATPVSEYIAHHPIQRTEMLRGSDISVPRVVSLRTHDAPTAEEVALKVVRTHSLPLRIVTTPTKEYTHTLPALMSIEHVRDALSHIRPGVKDIFIEEDITGIHITVYLIDGFRGEKQYTFPPVPTTPDTRRAWSQKEGKEAEQTARIAANILSLEGFIRVDLTITPKKIVVRDVRTTPDFTKSSPLYEALETVGATKKEVLHHIISRFVV